MILMAVLQPTDVYVIVNDAAQQMFGASAIKAVDTSSFVSVGQAMMNVGYENTLNALSTAIGRTIFSERPYTGKFRLLTADSMEYGAIVRKISYFYDGFEKSQDWNTDLDNDQLADGASIDPWTIRKRYPLEITFSGLKTLQKSFTHFRKQLRVAFHNEEEFSRFYQGLLVEVANELQIKMEAENRLTALNMIGSLYNTGTDVMVVNLTKMFNDRNNTTYKTAQLLGSNLKEFLPFFISTIKWYVRQLTDIGTRFHLTPVKNNAQGQPMQLLRHTPLSDQRLLISSQFMIDAEAQVLPQVFNDEYLKVSQAEYVNYWQNPASPQAVSVTPTQLNVTTGLQEKGAAVQLDNVIGLLYDYRGLAVNYMMEDVLTTPVNARGDYYNTVYHWAKMYVNDPTENMVLFYMSDTDRVTTLSNCVPPYECPDTNTDKPTSKMKKS